MYCILNLYNNGLIVDYMNGDHKFSDQIHDKTLFNYYLEKLIKKEKYFLNKSFWPGNGHNKFHTYFSLGK